MTDPLETGQADGARVPPYNLEAEQSLLGAMLMTLSAVEDAVRLVGSRDFYKPAHGIIFDTIADLWGRGDRPDPLTVAEDLRRHGLLDQVGGPAVLTTLQASTPATSNAHRYARIVAEHAALRELIRVGGEISEIGYDVPDDVGSAVDQAKALLGGVDTPLGPPRDFWFHDDYVDRPESQRAPWVVPGLLRANWRAVFVAGEGVGKTSLIRTVALCAAQGVHPFTHTHFPPCRVLIVDLENPDDHARHLAGLISPPIQRTAREYDKTRVAFFARQQGLNIRERAHRGELESHIAHHRPDLVVAGPVYKMIRKRGREDHAEVADDGQGVLDDLRTRYEFGLILEHHAPVASGGVRSMDPSGGMRWLQWPEFGFKLLRKDGGLELRRYREDRLPAVWPELVRRGSEWPWNAVYPAGTLSDGEAA